MTPRLSHLVSVTFLLIPALPLVFQGSFMVFHGFWLVSMVFHGSMLVFQGFSPECTRPKLYPGPTIQSRSAARRAAQDLVLTKSPLNHNILNKHRVNPNPKNTLTHTIQIYNSLQLGSDRQCDQGQTSFSQKMIITQIIVLGGIIYLVYFNI